MILSITFSLIVIYFFVTIFLYFYQNKLLYHPNINSRSNYELNHKVNEILITSDNDIIAWHYKKNENYKTLVFFHGNAGNLSNRIYKLNELSKLKLNYLIFAYRGFSGNKGKHYDAGLYKDAENVINWLKSKNIVENNIILYGESLGTAIAIHIAQMKNFAGIILEAPFTSMVTLGQKYYPIFPVKFILNDKYESLKKIINVNSPVLVLHGRKDKIVPFYMGEKIFEMANNPKFKYFSDLDDHMMNFDDNLINEIGLFIKNLN